MNTTLWILRALFLPATVSRKVILPASMLWFRAVVCGTLCYALATYWFGPSGFTTWWGATLFFGIIGMCFGNIVVYAAVIVLPLQFFGLWEQTLDFMKTVAVGVGCLLFLLASSAKSAVQDVLGTSGPDKGRASTYGG